MQNKIMRIGISTVYLLLIGFYGWSQCGSGQNTVPAINNGSCATAVTLTPGAACVNGTSCDGAGAAGTSACIGAGYECAWYKFTATASNMFVNIDLTATSGCHFRTEVFSGNCGSLTSLSCQSGAPLDDLHSLTGLTVNATYYVQVCYSPGGACGNGGWVEFCIEVGVPDPPCAVCSSPCGTAAGYPTNPTVQQVVDDCETSPFIPALQASSTHTYCYSFVATATSVNFNVIITSNCGSGNVTGFSWQLYDTPSCGSPIQSGTLASLTFSPVTIGNDYVFCYTFTVPSTCTHSQHCPYFVGATVLPIELVEFNAVEESNQITLNWRTAAEIDNDFFTLERTQDGIHFEEVGIVDGAGTSLEERSYRMIDYSPYKGISYYRLKQTDFNGASEYSSLLAVKMKGKINDLHMVPNPMGAFGNLEFNSEFEGKADLIIRDLFGQELLHDKCSITKGTNSVIVSGNTFESGMYLITLDFENEINTIKFVKE